MKLWNWKKRIWAGLSLALVVVLIFAAVNIPSFVAASAAKKKLPIYCVQRDDKCVSLTFDAAWGNR